MREALLLPLICVLLLCAAAAPSAGQRFPPVDDLPAPSALTPQPGLPDPLIMLDGRRVENREMWDRERRPELKQLFSHYMYGYAPSRPKLDYTVERVDRACFGGKATKREVALKIGGGRTIHLLVVLPNAQRQSPGVQRQSPVFVCIAFGGTFTAVNDPSIPVPVGWMYPNRPGVVNNRATEAGRGSMVDMWNIERTIDRGYGVALFYNGDVEPDDKSSTDGIRYSLVRKGRLTHDPMDWGAVAAWAWGAQCAVDYLVKDPAVDRKRIAVVGHSRNGKAALLAGAFDERISLVISHQAGCGGSAPSRGTVGESVKQINTVFPHWFNSNFKQFNDRTDLLPFDQHALVALCAPRPVLLSNAEQDTWANPAGQLDMLKAAEPVYRFLGVKDSAPTAKPPMGTLTPGRLSYFIRPGAHSMTRVDWDAFLDFADRNLK